MTAPGFNRHVIARTIDRTGRLFCPGSIIVSDDFSDRRVLRLLWSQNILRRAAVETFMTARRQERRPVRTTETIHAAIDNTGV